MTFEVDCRFDNCECVIEEHRYRKIKGQPKRPDTVWCRHMKEREADHCIPFDKNLFCRERHLRGQRGLDG